MTGDYIKSRRVTCEPGAEEIRTFVIDATGTALTNGELVTCLNSLIDLIAAMSEVIAEGRATKGRANKR